MSRDFWILVLVAGGILAANALWHPDALSFATRRARVSPLNIISFSTCAAQTEDSACCHQAQRQNGVITINERNNCLQCGSPDCG
jgi:hypothetical protein